MTKKFRNPRIQVVVEPEVNDFLVQLSELSGKTKSKIVGEVLVSAIPALKRLFQILEQTQKMPEEARKRVLENLQEQEAKLLSAIEEVQQLDAFKK